MSEAHEQAALMEWARMQAGRYPILARLHHIPNGGSRHPAEAANLKRQGVRSGVPDLCLPFPVGGKHGLYIEMKWGKNRPTRPQREWLAYLESAGYAVAVCYGWQEAADVIMRYLKGEEVRL